jgi:glutathione synthase/RimK-type ligase-like ATP-grasp enzyme
MIKKKILILVDYLRYFRRERYKCSSLDLETITTIFKNHQLNFEIRSFQDIIEAPQKPEDNIIWYASSDLISYKNYIEDILLYLNDRNTLIPHFDFFRAHENKGFQELLRRKFNLPVLESHYFGTVEELLKIINYIDYPVVLKKTTGSGSENVHLIHNQKYLIKKVKSLSKSSAYLCNLTKKYLKRYVFTNKYKYEYTKESLFVNNFIIQQFVPNLTNDWKVLIFYDKYFVFEREVRNNDFRASGSGKFFYRKFDNSLLDFCEMIFKKINSPWVSLDVCWDGSSYHLFEFQILNPGPIGLLNGPYYFRRDTNAKWEKILVKSDLSVTYAEAFIKYVMAIYDRDIKY